MKPTKFMVIAAQRQFRVGAVQAERWIRQQDFELPGKRCLYDPVAMQWIPPRKLAGLAGWATSISWEHRGHRFPIGPGRIEPSDVEWCIGCGCSFSSGSVFFNDCISQQANEKYEGLNGLPIIRHIKT